MLTLLTATGARPKAWAICERLMVRQVYSGPVRWVIVDDGLEAQPVTFQRDGWTLDVVRPSPPWKPGQNTQARNLLAGLAVIRSSEWVAVIEDDDWYAPDWLSTVERHLQKAECVGEIGARYYNLPARKGRQLGNTRHASLCSTAVRGAALTTLRQACRRAPKFIDLDLWRYAASRNLFTGHRVVGMKGLPGRGGIGMGHKAEFAGVADSDFALLREWIGSDVELYA